MGRVRGQRMDLDVAGLVHGQLQHECCKQPLTEEERTVVDEPCQGEGC